MIETWAQFGFTAAPGSTDDGRVRRITQHLLPVYASRLFDAQATAPPPPSRTGLVEHGRPPR
ncbi:hypothetical protein AB0399_35775 [Streptomyces sp. NPDC088194]|uniref:hypothetical protein n=1 Tax=Streptomyces sp. NPDC088194 TaxID=3154931 RepID=UPI00344B2B67